MLEFAVVCQELDGFLLDLEVGLQTDHRGTLEFADALHELAAAAVETPAVACM